MFAKLNAQKFHEAIHIHVAVGNASFQQVIISF